MSHIYELNIHSTDHWYSQSTENAPKATRQNIVFDYLFLHDEMQLSSHALRVSSHITKVP